jgi:hypothetical protein
MLPDTLRPAARIVCAVPRPQGSATSRTAGLARIHRAAIMPVTMAVAKTKISVHPLASDTTAGPDTRPASQSSADAEDHGAKN